MLQARVLTLRVLTNDGKVDVVVSGREARQGLADNDGSVDVELLTHSHVPRDVAGLRDGREKDT